MTNIDDKIRELLAVVEKQKIEVETARKQSEQKWKTNLAFEGLGNVINISTAKMDQIIKIATTLVQLRSNRNEAANLLGITLPDDLFFGYSFHSWIDDCKKRAASIQLQEKVKKLDELETRLNAIVSPEQRRQFELEALTKELIG